MHAHKHDTSKNTAGRRAPFAGLVAGRIGWWEVVGAAAVAAMLLLLALAPAPESGIACARLDVARKNEPQVNIGSRSLCVPAADAARRGIDRSAAVTIGMLGHVVFLRLEPVDGRAGSGYTATVEAWSIPSSKESDVLFRWEGHIALPRSPFHQARSEVDAAPDFSVKRIGEWWCRSSDSERRSMPASDSGGRELLNDHARFFR